MLIASGTELIRSMKVEKRYKQDVVEMKCRGSEKYVWGDKDVPCTLTRMYPCEASN